MIGRYLEKCLENVMPAVEVKSRRVGGLLFKFQSEVDREKRCSRYEVDD